MSPYKKKLIKNVEARVLPYSVFILLIVASLMSIFFVLPPQTKTASAASANSFLYHKKITVNHAYIESDLTNFPILVHDNTGNLLNNVLANASDIAFFDSTNTTQFPHEIEKYNNTSGELWAWVNVSSVSSTVDTVFYMYYGDSDGGYSVGYNPTSVWSNGYLAVFHMNEDSGMLIDRTGNNNNFIPVGTVTYHASGQIGYGISNDGSLNYFKNTTMDLTGLSEMSIELWYSDSGYISGEAPYLFGSYWGGTPDDIRIAFNDGTGANDCGYNMFWDDGTAEGSADYTHPYLSGFRYYASVMDADSFVNNYIHSSDVNGKTVDSSVAFDFSGLNNDHAIGARTYVAYTPSTKHPFDGILDEMRFSSVARNDSWINASYDSANETTGFLTLGSEGGGPVLTSVTIKGLPNNRVTWSGTAGSTVWCNATGDNYETLEINMTVNSTTNITEIRVWVGDLNDTGATITADNINMYASVDNLTWRDFGTFTSGGSNISMNTTTWTWTDDPFPIVSNSSIYLRFTLAIPVGQTADTYYSSASDAWKIYIGHYT